MTEYPTPPSSNSTLGGLDAEKIKKNALIALIVGFACGGVLPGILGLLGYLKADTEPATAKKFTKWAWIAFAILWVLGIILFVLYILVIAAAVSQSGTTTY